MHPTTNEEKEMQAFVKPRQLVVNTQTNQDRRKIARQGDQQSPVSMLADTEPVIKDCTEPSTPTINNSATIRLESSTKGKEREE